MAEQRYVDPNSGAAPQPGGQVSGGTELPNPPEEAMRDMAKTVEEAEQVEEKQREERRERTEAAAEQVNEQHRQAEESGEMDTQELPDPEPQSPAEFSAQKQYTEGDAVHASEGSGEPQPGQEPLIRDEAGEGEVEDAEEDEDEGEDDGPPNRNANKRAWVNYARRQGMSEEEADEMTKQELVDRYGRS